MSYSVDGDAVSSKMIQNGGMWQCTDCDYNSKYKANVYKHVEVRHVEAQQYECSVCGKVLRGINSYNVHIYQKHRNK